MTLPFLLLFATIFWIILGTTRFKLHPFLVLLSASIFLGIGTGIPFDELAGILGKGMGKTMQSIGLLILFGTVIGVVLEQSNATHTIANALLEGLAKLPLPYAVSCIGYLVAIPVFCDSAFVILSALNKRLSQQTKTPLVALTVALSTGLFAPHVLVPPTPGPLAAAANLELENLFLLILFGGILALLLVLTGAAYAHYLSKKTPFTVENITLKEETITALPSLGKAVAPILFPIVLMALGTAIPFLPFQQNESALLLFLQLLCSPSFALGIGMLLAFRLLRNSSVSLNEVVEKGIQTAAPILIITAMGGTLGLIIQQLPLTAFLENNLTQNSLGLLLPFLLAAGLKTAQGSSTVAIITASSIVFPLLGVLGLETEMGKVWVILAVGVGSMTVSHANDSYFWIVAQMGGMDVKTAYRNHSFATFLQGTLGIFLVLVGHWVYSTIVA